MDIRELAQRMPGEDGQSALTARQRWDGLAKPRGSLGLLEEAVVHMAALTGDGDVHADKRRAIVFCADNGVTAQGVASTPAEVTALMAGVIARGESSVGLMARCAGADVLAVDIGMFHRVKGVRDLHIASGTADMTTGPAMTREQAWQAVETGVRLVRESKNEGYDIVCTGEMGIGNTTTSSAMAAVLLNAEVETVTGRGAGLSDEGLCRKRAAISRALSVNTPNAFDSLDVLMKVGGFDIAAMCGAFLGGALYHVPIIVDGFISMVAALTAARLCPAAQAYMLPSHLSAEPAARMIAKELDFHPILHGGLRLGEGTGAVALLPFLDMASAVYHRLMTYGDIGM